MRSDNMPRHWEPDAVADPLLRFVSRNGVLVLQESRAVYSGTFCVGRQWFDVPTEEEAPTDTGRA